MTSGEATILHERSPRALAPLLAFALVLAVFAAFAPALSAAFVNWDDPYTLEDLRTFGGEPWHFWYATGQVDPWQPMAWWSLMLDHAAWGLDAGDFAPQAGHFHATSIAIHALAAVAFFALARKILALALPAANERARTFAAVLAACFFAIHPLRVESVAWLSERRDVLSGLFYLLAANAWLCALPREPARVVSKKAAVACCALAAVAVLVFHASVELPTADPARWRGLGPFGLAASLALIAVSVPLAARASGRRGKLAIWFAVAVACFVLALISKGLTVVLPVMLFVLDAWPLKRIERRSVIALLVEKAPLFALSLIVGAVAHWAQVRFGKTLLDWQQHTLVERIAQAFYGLGFYPSRTLVPMDLLPLYELPDDLRFGEPRFFVSAIAVIGVTLALIALRKRLPAALVAWVAFGLAIAPVVGLTQAGPQIVADRYSYLSCMPFALLAGGAWLAWSSSSSSARVVAAIAAVAAVAALVAATYAQTATWRDSETLWSRTMRVDPTNAMAHSMLAAAISDRAEKLDDRDARRTLLVEVDRLYRRSLELDATPLPQRWRNFGTNLLRLDRPAEAIDPLSRYVATEPQDADGQTNYGVALRMVGRTSEGVEHMRRSVELDPKNAKNWTQLAMAFEELGDRANAIDAYEHVARLWPRHEPTRRKLAELRGG